MKTFQQYIKENNTIEEGLLGSIGSGARLAGSALSIGAKKVGSAARTGLAKYYGQDPQMTSNLKLGGLVGSSIGRAIINAPGRFAGAGNTVRTGRQAAIDAKRQEAEERAGAVRDIRDINRVVAATQAELKRTTDPKQKAILRDRIQNLRRSGSKLNTQVSAATIKKYGGSP